MEVADNNAGLVPTINVYKDSLMQLIRLMIILVLQLTLCINMASAAESNSHSEYQLGSQDRLQIRIFDLRTGTGEAYQWPAFNGEYIVDSSGNISLPLIGGLPAAGRSTSQLENEIATRLQAKVGLAQRPYAAVQISKYRPFYILGSVQNPGEYEYRPGLTVIQAVSIAGGLSKPRDIDTLAYGRDKMSLHGEIAKLTSERLGLLIKQARLYAELNGQKQIKPPAELEAQSSGSEFASLLREESSLLQSRQNVLDSQVAVVQQSKNVLSEEINTLSQKDASLERQIMLAKKELSDLNTLMSKGLTSSSRQFSAEQTAASFESGRLDVQVAKLRAQQDLSKADRDIIDIRDRRRSENLAEVTEIKKRLIEVSNRLKTNQQLVSQLEISAPAVIKGRSASAIAVYQLVGSASIKSLPASLNAGDPLSPGDVVSVSVEPAAEEVPTEASASSIFGRNIPFDR